MTLTHSQERVAPAERIAIRCVDSDVHPVPKRGVLQEYIPEPIRTKYFRNHRVGETIYYDAPDYAHAYAMRVDTFPDDGEFACSDPTSRYARPSWKPVPTSASSNPRTRPAGSPPKPPRRCPTRTTPGRPSTGWTARRTGTNAGAARSWSPSKTPKAEPARSRSGPSTRTWPRS